MPFHHSSRTNGNEYLELKGLDTDVSSPTKKSHTQVTVTEEELPLRNRGHGLLRANTDRDDWRTGVRERMPWWGFSALLVALLCSAGSFMVLRFSDDVSAANWPDLIAPNVCLSILGSLSTIAVTYAIGEGIAISWWRSAMRGASVKELHNAWAFSASVTSIFTQFKYFNAIALASLMAKLSIVDSVLFQRATTTYLTVDWTPKPVDIATWAETTFPVTGQMGVSNDTDFVPLPRYRDAVFDWIKTGNQVFDSERFLPSCEGVGCEYWQLGPGFAFDCEASTFYDDFLVTAPATSDSTPFNLFSIDLTMGFPDTVKNYSRLELTMKSPIWDELGIFDDDPVYCPVNFTFVSCEMRPATLNYSIWYVQSESIEESRLAEVRKSESGSYASASDQNKRYSVSAGAAGTMLGSFCGSIPGNFAGVEDASAVPGRCWTFDIPTRQNLGVEVVSNQDIYEPWVPGANASLLGIYQALKDQIDIRFLATYQEDKWYASASGSPAYNSISKLPSEPSSCGFHFGDPYASLFYAVDSVNNLMRQLGVSPALHGLPYGTIPEPNHNVRGVQYFRDIYHSTDYRYAIAACVCTILVVICVLPAYWGFWQLGRNVTLGPMEIAYAFQGPAFAGVHDTNGHVDTLVKAVGDKRVLYTEVDDGTGTKLAFKTG